MKLSAKAIREILMDWFRAWDDHDLNGVMALFHDDILFENWTGGRAQGREALHKAWFPWFEDHGDFKFTEEDTFIDEAAQKVLYRWTLEWPSRERGYEGGCERRRGVDVIHFRNGKIIKKLTYSKTVIEIDDKRVSLRASLSEDAPGDA